MKKYFAIFLITLTALVFSFFIVYRNQQNKIDKLTKRISELSERQPSPVESKDPAQIKTYTSNKGEKVTIYRPNNEKVTSPLVIFGEIPGKWSFEASFPIYLEDNNGKRLAASIAQLQSDWMTDEQVPFVAKLSFNEANLISGRLVLKKDNPSGLTENDDQIIIPVKLD